MATGAPGTNGVWLYGEDDSEATFSALLNKAGTTVNTQLGLDRTRLTTLEARKITGLVPIKPTSVIYTSGTGAISTLGTVDFTLCSKIQIVNAFVGYTNYKIVFDCVSSTSFELLSRYASGTTENTASNYQVQILEASSSTISGFRASNQTQQRLGLHIANSRTDIEATVYNPNVATFTNLGAKTTGYSAGAWVQEYVDIFNGNATFDGISFYSNNGAQFSGKVSIYGFNE